jgi:hypothetical protein
MEIPSVVANDAYLHLDSKVRKNGGPEDSTGKHRRASSVALVRQRKQVMERR